MYSFWLGKVGRMGLRPIPKTRQLLLIEKGIGLKQEGKYVVKG